jgi:hypothetical protein
MKHINNKIKSDCAHFNDNFNDLEKSIVSKSINEKYRQLTELGEIAVDTIDKMDEEIEYKDDKITVLEDKLINTMRLKLMNFLIMQLDH